MQLSDKVILVTGSTTGIGEATARRCLKEGARVMIHGRDAERGNALVAELGSQAAFVPDDLSDPAAPERVVAATIAAFGRLHGLVNNAAYVVRSNIETTSPEFFDKVMAINVRAPLMMIKAALPHLKESRGSVVNIGSINGYTGEARQLDYSISKAGLMCMSRNLANYLAQEHVRVNHFNVGWVLSPNEYKLKMREGLPEGWPELVEKDNVPTGKMTMPENIAAHAAFWLSDDSRPISGSVMELEQYPIIGRLPVKEGKPVQ